MAYQVVHANLRSEWSSLVQVSLQSRTTPYSSFVSRMRRLDHNRKEHLDLLQQEMLQDKTLEVVKVVDIRTGQIVGYGFFNICLDQIASSSMLRRPSPAIGSESGMVLKDSYLAAPRAAPHVFWNTVEILPHVEHEITSLIIDWGINRAASLGVELWHYTLEPSALLYEMKGIRAATERVIDLENEKPEAEESSITRFSCWGMWRPAPGT